MVILRLNEGCPEEEYKSKEEKVHNTIFLPKYVGLGYAFTRTGKGKLMEDRGK